MNIKSEKARISASYRWGNANALQPNSERIANGMRNDAIKVKEIKKSKKKPFSPNGDIDPAEFTGVPPGMVL